MYNNSTNIHSELEYEIIRISSDRLAETLYYRDEGNVNKPSCDKKEWIKIDLNLLDEHRRQLVLAWQTGEKGHQIQESATRCQIA